MLDEHLLGRGGTALHAIDHDHVGAGLDGQFDVIFDAGRAELDVDRHLPVGHFAELADFDGQIVGASPVGVPARAALVDALGQRTHAGNAGIDLLSQQHSAATRFRTLADDDLDRIGLEQVFGIEAVSRRQTLVHERLGRFAFLGCHPAVAGGRARSHRRRGPADRFLGAGRQRPETHARHGDRNLEFDRPLGVPRAEPRVGEALLAIAFQRIP